MRGAPRAIGTEPCSLARAKLTISVARVDEIYARWLACSVLKLRVGDMPRNSLQLDANMPNGGPSLFLECV